MIEDAGLVLLVLGRRQISYDDALDGLVRDAFGSADRLTAAVAEARASGLPVAEVDLLERAASRARARAVSVNRRSGPVAREATGAWAGTA